MKYKFAATFAILSIAGCANTSEYLRSQPVTEFYSPNEVIEVPGELQGLVTARCAKHQGTVIGHEANNKNACLYISVDASNLMKDISAAKRTDVRDLAISFLMSASDMNCSNFLHRAFANRAGMELSNGMTSDLATGLSAGTAHATPALSAALSIGNLIVGKGTENITSAYYQDKTFQALDAAIEANRLSIKARILTKQQNARKKTDPVPYDLVQSLSDIRNYDDACSVKGGLSRLVTIASDKMTEETAKADRALAGDKPASSVP